jgi:predicted nucleotidyltransferase
MNYLKDLSDRCKKAEYIQCAFVYGSFARGQLKDDSDLDVILVRKKGVKNACKCLWFLLKERAYALRNRITLEVYLADGISWLDRIRMDEVPVILDDKEKTLEESSKRFQSLETALKLNSYEDSLCHS